MKRTKNEECPIMCLTDDLLLEIFLRLPLKSLGICNTVCKSWDSLISDPNFAISRIEFSNLINPPLTLVSQKHNYISTLNFEDYYDITKGVCLILSDDQFPANECEDYFCFLIGSCDGLICIYLKPTSKRLEDLLFIWNPVTGERNEIVLPEENGKTYIYENSSWFGYVTSEDDYKIFLVYGVGSPVLTTRLCVYSLKKKPRWRGVHGGDGVLGAFGSWSRAVFLNEALHWLNCRQWIIKFDLVKETFERVPICIESDIFEKSRGRLLGVIGEEDCLCVMFVQYPLERVPNTDSEEDSEEEEEEEEEEDQEQVFELWKLEEYGKWDSWTKSYRIELQKGIFRNPIEVLGFTYTGIVCIRVDYGLWLYDPSDDPPSYTIVRDPNFAKVYKVTDYVESLVSPFDLP